MNRKSKQMAHGALIAALYVLLTYLQYTLFPESVYSAIQFRASEALCVLAFFTPAAIAGLSVGCFLFNLILAGSMPLDLVCGTLATFLATGGMWLTRKLCFWKTPFPGLLLPALCNGLLVGWELTFYYGMGFGFNFGCVALGELGVLFTLGLVLYHTLRRPDLKKLFV